MEKYPIESISRIRKLNEKGSVWLAKSSELGDVAAKFILKRDSSLDVERSLKEIEKISEIGLQSIIRYYGYCEDDEKLVILMKYEKQGNISDFFHKNEYYEYSCTLIHRFKICIDICHVLSILHDQKIMHRNLKCQNILLDDDLNPKLSDFCFGRKYTPNENKILEFITPEDIEGDLSFPTDIYFLGKVIWEIVTGQTLMNIEEIQTVLPKSIGEDFKNLITSCCCNRSDKRPNGWFLKGELGKICLKGFNPPSIAVLEDNYRLFMMKDNNTSKNDRLFCLYLALLKGDHQIIKELINFKSTENEYKKNNRKYRNKDLNNSSDFISMANYLIHLASSKGHLSIVEYLVNNGANIQSVTNDGSTCLHHASSHGHLNICEYLVSKGADVYTESKEKKRPVDLALLSHHNTVVEFFETVMTDIANFQMASEQGNLEKIQELHCLGININCKNSFSLTALHHASSHGHLNIVEYLVNNGADVNIVNKNRNTCLHFASLNGHLSIVEYLVNNGANIQSVTNDGSTCLHLASFHGHLNICEYLVSKGADVNFVNKNRNTCLHFASIKGHLSIIEYLVSKGADVNFVNKNRNTCLHHASSNGHLSIVEYLVSKGADVNFVNKKRNTCLHRASTMGHHKVVEFLLNTDMIDKSTILH